MKDSRLRLAVILWGVAALMNVVTFVLNLVRGNGDALLLALQGVTAAASLVTFALVLRISHKKEE